MTRSSLSTGRRACFLSLLLLGSGCGGLAEDEGPAHGRIGAALSTTTFAETSPLCPTTTDWGAWDQTSLSTWDDDVEPVVQWIIDRTGISSSTYSGHSPSIGRAADWRPHSRDEGTQLANWLLANTKSGGKPLGIEYIIWQAQIYLISSGVKPMEDRGSFTQNHCDHIHISFVARGSVAFDAASVTPWGDPPPPDAGPSSDGKTAPSAVDAARSGDLAPADAGASPWPASSADLRAAAHPADPPGVLFGGCALARREPQGRTSAPWLLLLFALRVVRRHRARMPR